MVGRRGAQAILRTRLSLEELRPHLWRSGVGVVQPLDGHGQDAVRIAGADAAHVGVPVKLHGPFVMT